jgi:hypothetical protein
MARDQQVICLKRQWKYFCEEGWTGVSVICPPGAINRLGRAITIGFCCGSQRQPIRPSAATNACGQIPKGLF